VVAAQQASRRPFARWAATPASLLLPAAQEEYLGCSIHALWLLYMQLSVMGDGDGIERMSTVFS
jgi:hypothetical protein